MVNNTAGLRRLDTLAGGECAAFPLSIRLKPQNLTGTARAACRSFRMKQATPRGEDKGLRGRRILIVEDEFLIASDLAGYFSQLGAEIVRI